MKQYITYQKIDMIQTGKKIKQYVEGAELSVKDIQTYLHLSCPQPIYRWFKGKILPSVDHLLMLSELFDVHMEELLVKSDPNNILEIVINRHNNYNSRLAIYYRAIMKQSMA